MTEKRNRPWAEPVTGLRMSLSDPGLSLCDPGLSLCDPGAIRVYWIFRRGGSCFSECDHADAQSRYGRDAAQDGR